jgi:cysteine desulfurase
MDNNASTPLGAEAFEAMRPWLEKRQANPSSLHKAGQAARSAVEAVRDQIAKALGVWPEEIFFTSGATEACNIALRGTGRPILYGATEHHAVLFTAQALGGTAVPVTPQGSVDLGALEKVCKDQLVACMHANNETGVLNPVEDIARLAHRHGGLFFCDITQSLGKLPLDLRKIDCDIAAASAHKFGGPQGVGFLYKKRALKLKPLMTGGSQEQGLRPGTENVAGIVGMGAALAAAKDPGWEQARQHLAAGLKKLWPSALEHGAGAARISNTLSISFLGVEKDTLLLKLDQLGLQASAGSACAAGASEPSHVLAAMGLGAGALNSVVRFSLGAGQELPEATDAVGRVGQALADLKAAGLI